MADVPLLASQSIAAPLDYVIPGAQEIIPKSITASFDGSGAGGSFVPTLVILAPNGTVLAACPTDITVAAGASADVSWFPRVGGFGSAGGSGIRFNTDNEGGYLDVTTNDTGPGGWGMKLLDDSGGGFDVESNNFVQVKSTGIGGLTIENDNAAGQALNVESASGIVLDDNSGSGVLLHEESTGGVTVQDDGTGGFLATSDNGPVNLTAGTTSTLRSTGLMTVESFAGVDVFDIGSIGIRIQTTAGQVAIQTAPGNHPIGLEGGYPIIRNADSSGGVAQATIQDRLDATDSYQVLNLAASAVYFSVTQGGRVSMPHLPTSAAGLAAGDLWNNVGVVNIV